MASIKFQYRSKKDVAALEARLTYKNENGNWKQQGTRLKLEVSKKYWNDYGKGISFRDADKTNLKTEIDLLYTDLSKFILERLDQADVIGKGWLKDAVHEYYNPIKEKPIPDDLLEYWSFYMDFRKNEIVEGSNSYKKWIVIKHKIRDFFQGTGRRYKIIDVDDDFVNAWVDWSKGMNYSNTTIKKSLKFIKIVCVHARRKGIAASRDLDTLKTDLKSEVLPKVYLSFDELDRIEALEDLPDYLDNARDWLVISCYTGQRISDFMRFDRNMLRADDNGRTFIDLKQQKTRKDVTAPIISKVKNILEKRNGDFPRRISDQKYNDYIKEVCRRAGVIEKMKGKKATIIKVDGKRAKRGVIGYYPKYELVGSHVGRRSFATNYYSRMKTSRIKNITGHSTEQMLLVYIGKSSRDTAAEAYDDMER